MAKLIFDFEGNQREVQLSANAIVIGRSEEADVVLASKAFSRKHFRIYREGLIYYAQDLESSNGTRVDAEKLGAAPMPLVNGARVVAGGIAFLFDDETGVHAPDRKPHPSTQTKRVIAAPESTPGPAPATIIYHPADDGPAKEYRLESRLTIGRKDHHDIVIKDPVVSSDHCTIERRDGGYVITDHGSSNGTFINGERIEQHVLQDREVITLGKHIRLVFSHPVNGASDKAHDEHNARLVYQQEDGRPIKDAVLKGKIRVGRKEGNDLVIIDPVVSSEHCVIEERGGKFFLTDLGSSNGTFVGGQRLSTEYELHGGEIITLGTEVQLFFIRPKAAPQTASPAHPPLGHEHKPHHAPDKIHHEPGKKPELEPELIVAGADAKPHAFNIGTVVVLACAALLVAAGALLPMFIFKDKPSGNPPVISDAPQVAALSFEAEGDLGGWAFASSGNSRAALDERGVYDGARAVVIDCPTMADVALVTGSALAMPVPACGTISFWTRGTVKGALTAVASASSGARESVLGAVRLSNVDAGNWAQCSIPIASFAQLDRPKLRVELQGLSGTLWLDRFTVEAKAAPKTGEPVVNGPGVTLLQNDVGSFVISGADSAASLNVRTGLLGQPDARAMLSDVNVKPRRVATQCRVLKAGGGEVQGETIAMEAPPAVNRVPGGVELVWRVKKAAPVLSLSATHTKLTLADERGNIVDVSNPSAASVSGIMEIGFGELTASFMAPCTVEFGDAVGESIDVNVVPSGAEVIVLRVYHYSPAYARTLANVTAGMESLFAQRRMSDAREYAVFLAGVKAAAYSEFAGEGRKKRQLIDDGLNALWLKADAAMLKARSSKDAEAAKEAKLTLGQIMRDYYLDQRVESAKTLHAEMVELENLLRKGVDPVQVDTTGLRGKKPERPRSDEIFKLDSERAATLLASARESYASGNWLCAFMFADNVRWNYHYTDSATEAEQLATTIEQAWNDAETRDGWIVAEGVKAQKYESDGALGNALEVLRGILARYPRCAQAPVVLRKIRELEELGK